jgi:flagellar hook-length control protein FliK
MDDRGCRQRLSGAGRLGNRARPVAQADYDKVGNTFTDAQAKAKAAAATLDSAVDGANAKATDVTAAALDKNDIRVSASNAIAKAAAVKAAAEAYQKAVADVAAASTAYAAAVGALEKLSAGKVDPLHPDQATADPVTDKMASAQLQIAKAKNKANLDKATSAFHQVRVQLGGSLATLQAAA